MKNFTFSLFLSTLFSLSGFSQITCQPGIAIYDVGAIDNFQTNFPGCTVIEGSIMILGDEVTNLNGLSAVTEIQGSLWINDNGNDNSYPLTNLTDLSGLNNLTTIGGELNIGEFTQPNTPLTSLNGLNNLTSIGFGIRIKYNESLESLSGLNNLLSVVGDIQIDHNTNLSSISSLINLTSVNEGSIVISDNPALVNLSGLDNIDAGSIGELWITNNALLSICNVQSVCDQLANPNAFSSISGNASGCESVETVLESCVVGIPDSDFESDFSIYPNPAINEVFISGKNGQRIREINFFNQLGQIVIKKTEINGSIDISQIQQGIYIVELITADNSKSDGYRIRKKLLIR